MSGVEAEGRYLRLSVTPACGFHCPYCQPDGPVVMKAERLLGAEAYARAVSLLTELGVHRVRLTGGEPLSRPDVVHIVESLAGLPRLAEVALTTNADRLERLARPLAEAGLKRVNVHVDSLRPERFARLTGGKSLRKVLLGIEAARRWGLEPLKLNVVLMRGLNDDEIEDFGAFACREGVQVRFIELMDTGPSRDFVRRHFMSGEEARERLARRFSIERRFRREVAPHPTTSCSTAGAGSSASSSPRPSPSATPATGCA